MPRADLILVLETSKLLVIFLRRLLLRGIGSTSPTFAIPRTKNLGSAKSGVFLLVTRLIISMISLVETGSSSATWYIPDLMVSFLLIICWIKKHKLSMEINERLLSNDESGYGMPLEISLYRRPRLPLSPGP